MIIIGSEFSTFSLRIWAQKNNILLTQFTDNENLEDKNSTERNQNYVDT